MIPKEPLAGALYSCCILRAMEKLTPDSKEKEALLENANYFENLAIDLLTQFHQTDSDLSYQILTRSVNLLNGRTCLHIASLGRALRFISHTSCQNLLDIIWFGQIDPSSSFIQILIAIICPPLLFALHYRSKNEIDSMIEIFSENEVL